MIFFGSHNQFMKNASRPAAHAPGGGDHHEGAGPRHAGERHHEAQAPAGRSPSGIYIYI